MASYTGAFAGAEHDLGARGAGEPPRFAVVGTGRSGSGFISRVFRAAGVECGHEEWFVPSGPGGRSGLDGDSSWLAVPHLDDFAGPVLHQVRHPLDVIRSLAGIRMFSDVAHGPYRWFMYAHLPGLVGDDLLDAMRWYVEWNRRCEVHATVRYRVEAVDAARLGQLCAAVGAPVAPAVAEEALGAVSNRFNARPRAALTWDDLPAGPLRDRVQEMAEAYGYCLS